jgi:hypothetical protein
MDPLIQFFKKKHLELLFISENLIAAKKIRKTTVLDFPKFSSAGVIGSTLFLFTSFCNNSKVTSIRLF